MSPRPTSRPLRRAARLALTSIAVALCTGCDVKEEVRAAARGGAGERPDSLRVLETEIARLRAIAAEKDTLLLDVQETQLFIDDIDRALTQLARPESARVAEYAERELSADDIRTDIRRKVEAIAVRIADSEARAQERADRIQRARRTAEGEELVELRRSIERFGEITRQQQERIVELTGRLQELEAANAELTIDRDRLFDSVATLTQRSSQAYYVAGTRDELLHARVVTQTDGVRLPGGRRGRALRPAATLRVDAYMPLDRLRDSTITLPDPNAEYEIVSAHDPAFLDSLHGRTSMRGTLRIADPERFWAQSRFLILVKR
jgi:hypothetical protein